MKRYCISPIVGFGTATDAYRAAVSDVAPTVAIIPVGIDGRPLYKFCLCLVSTDKLANVLEVSNVYVLPDYVLDAKMDGMESKARADMVQNIGAYVLDDKDTKLDTTHKDIDGFRDLLVKLGKQFDSVFNINDFDVKDG